MATAKFFADGSDWELAQQEAQRQRQMADALRQQSQAPLQGGMAGRVYVPPSITQGLAKLFQAYTSGKMGTAADEGLRTAKAANDQRRTQGMSSIVEALSGKPAQQFDMPANEMGDEATTGMSAAVAPDMNKAMAQAMQSGVPDLQNMGMQWAGQMPQIEARKAEGAENRSFRRDQLEATNQARTEQLAAQTQARAEQMQQAHALRMEGMQAQNASREQMAQAQREFQAQQAEMNRQHQQQMRQLGGSARSESPYFQPVQTAQGVFAFNARTGKVEPVTGPSGASIVGSQSDPKLQGEIAGAKEGAKAEVEKGVEAVKAVKRSDIMLSQIQTAENIMKGGKATESGVGSAVDFAGRMVGASSKSAQDAAKLESLSGWLVSNVPRMEGPQSNYDVQIYQVMAGKIGDRTVPLAERLAAVGEVKKLQEKYKTMNQTAETPKAPKRIRLDAQGNIIP